MSNALLAMSGPAFGNMDITTYDVYSVYIQMSNGTGTVFNGVSWDWCVIDISNAYYRIIRPIALTRASIASNATAMGYVGFRGSDSSTIYATWTATATSLSVQGDNIAYTCVAYVPSN